MVFVFLLILIFTLVVFVLFISIIIIVTRIAIPVPSIALHHILSSQPDDIERTQVAFHQFIADRDERAKFILSPNIRRFQLAKLDIEDIIVSMACERDKVFEIIALEEIGGQDAMGKTECELRRAPVGPVEEGIEELVKYLDRVVLEIAPMIFYESVGW